MVATADVVNVALRLIGGGRITNLTQDLPQAVAANDIYSNLLDDLLRSHPWNFATQRIQLSKLATDPAFGFDNAFVLPSDWLRTVSVHPSDSSHYNTFYREELLDMMKVIVTSATDLYMRYIARVIDVNLWSADFRRAMSTALARDLAIPVSGSRSLRDDYKKEHRQDMGRAKSADAMGSSPEQVPPGTWITRRGRRLPNVGTVD